MSKLDVSTRIVVSSGENENRSRISISGENSFLISIKTSGSDGYLFYVSSKSNGGVKYVFKVAGSKSNIPIFYYDYNYLYIQTRYGSYHSILPLKTTIHIIQEQIGTIPSGATPITVQ